MNRSFIKIVVSLSLALNIACSSSKKAAPASSPSPGATPVAQPDKLTTDDPKKIDEEKKNAEETAEKKMGGPIILEDGLEYQFIAIKNLTLEPVDYMVRIFKITQEKLKFKIVSFQEDKSLYKTPKALREELNAKIIINGGFFGDSKKPNVADGLLILEGKKISDINPKLSGVLTIQENILSIIETEKLKLEEMKPDASAIQGTPLIIDRGGKIGVAKPDLKTTKDKRTARTAICTKANGDILLMVTDAGKSGLYLYEMAAVAKQAGCDIAINLDGGPATSISVKEYSHPMFKNLEIPAQDDWIHPNLIVIE